MAKKQASLPSGTMNMKAHHKTYEGFVTLTVAGIIGCLYVLVALAAVAFGSGIWGTVICWLTLIGGTALLVLDMRADAGWKLAGGGLAFFTLLTLLNV